MGVVDKTNAYECYVMRFSLFPQLPHISYLYYKEARISLVLLLLLGYFITKF